MIGHALVVLAITLVGGFAAVAVVYPWGRVSSDRAVTTASQPVKNATPRDRPAS